MATPKKTAAKEITVTIPVEMTLGYMTAPIARNKRGAFFTLHNTRDNTHVTYRTRREIREWEGKTYENLLVEVMDGTDNVGHYRAIGTLSEKGWFKPYNLKHGRKGMAKIEEVKVRQNIFAWFAKRRWQATEAKIIKPMPPTFLFKGDGCCSRCGRKLTNPDSLATLQNIGKFLGPVCMKKYGTK